jgi:hypothetical protein
MQFLESLDIYLLITGLVRTENIPVAQNLDLTLSFLFLFEPIATDLMFEGFS